MISHRRSATSCAAATVPAAGAWSSARNGTITLPIADLPGDRPMPDEIDALVDWQLTQAPELPTQTCGRCDTTWISAISECPTCSSCADCGQALDWANRMQVVVGSGLVYVCPTH